MFQKFDNISIGYTDLPHITMFIRDGRECFMYSILISEVQFVLLKFLPSILQTTETINMWTRYQSPNLRTINTFRPHGAL
jgi:hypothetical protein